MEYTVQDYYIKNVIREDIIGTLYLGVHQPTNTKAIIRLVNPSLVDELFHYNLSNKNNALVGLSHPAIGKFYKYIKQKGQVYLISEYVPNATTLMQYVTEYDQSIAEEKIWYIFKQIVDAFDYAHTKGVNHFAVHPDNIRIITADQIKVLDFGVVSLFISHLNKGLPQNFETYNIQYRSPEHVLSRDLDIRSDIYSLGVILFELITRQSLYPSSLLLSEINSKILHETLPSLNLYTKTFADSYMMQAIVDKATAKDPSHRFQDFRELKESLLAEKNKREKNAIKNLRQEVKAGKKAHSSEKNFAGKSTKQTNQRKPLGMALLAIGLIIGAINIGLYFNHHLFNKSAISLREKINKIVNSGVSVEHTKTTEPDDANEPDTSSVIKQKAKPANPDLSGVNKSAASLKGSEPEISETSTSKARSSGKINSVKKISQAQLRNRLEDFYEALSSKDIDQVSSYYAPKLTKFFNERNVTNRQLQSLLLKAWRRTPEDKHEILWDTLQSDYDQEGNYTTEFYMNYVYRRANTNTWRSRKIYTMIKMDNNLKIFYMSGD